MKANFLTLGLFGVAGASAVLPRDGYQPSPVGYPTKPTHGSYPTQDDYATSPQYADENDYEDGYDYKNSKGASSNWKPKSKSPEFFNLRVDQKCGGPGGDGPDEPVATDANAISINLPGIGGGVGGGRDNGGGRCPLNGYAIRLEGGMFIATPYSKWWDPKLPTFFVDDDTQMYTVSKDPLQVYIDNRTGALKYTKLGWLPPYAIATSFFHTGNNPLGLVDPSPSYLSWPSTQGGTFRGNPWILCPLGNTQQYQVFINNNNFGAGGPAGVTMAGCITENLAAVNANPWQQETSPAPPGPPQSYPGYGQ